MDRLGTGIGWRPEIADGIAELPGVDWVEVVAENICPGHLPPAVQALRARGTTVVPHGVSLGLGGAERPDPGRLAALAERAEALGAPLVTEHIAFVRAGGPLTASSAMEAGHLLPLPRTRDALDVLCENVRIAQDALPVPLAVENIAALVNWPGEEMTEGQFLAELVERTGVRLLIDVANLHTNLVNRNEDPATALDELPVEAIAYVHVAGGIERDGVWHDTHAHPVTRPVLDVLAELCARVTPPGVLLERDEDFPATGELAAELDAIRTVLKEAPTPTVLPAPAPAPVPRPLRATGVAVPRGLATATGTVGATGTATTTATGTAGATGTVTATGTATATATVGATGTAASTTDAARQRLAVAQTALLSALVAGTPAPEGFDRRRLLIHSRALTAKRASVVAKIAPELPDILGGDYRPGFLAYARHRPMRHGYRQDAMDFAVHLLAEGRPADPDAHRRLTQWWRDRAGPKPPRGGPAHRLAHAVRRALHRR
ncbi:DUF692 domain-containing protein [Streptomyces chrestomyceticus]|uniref:DUF692 domain-containing protein n=1 Tax=Streptomyces chrestomyceticus TaxID=68185 RepID=A0ABU7WKV0_9ACTN